MKSRIVWSRVSLAVAVNCSISGFACGIKIGSGACTSWIVRTCSVIATFSEDWSSKVVEFDVVESFEFCTLS